MSFRELKSAEEAQFRTGVIKIFPRYSVHTDKNFLPHLRNDGPVLKPGGTQNNSH